MRRNRVGSAQEFEAGRALWGKLLQAGARYLYPYSLFTNSMGISTTPKILESMTPCLEDFYSNLTIHRND